MNQGRTVFSQLVEFLPTYQFQICVERYQGNRYVKDFSCWDQFLCLAFAQLTYRESLRDIEVIYCLRSKLESSRMAPKQRPKIEIKKTHRGPLLSFNQAVTVDCSDFLGTALIFNVYFLRPALGLSGLSWLVRLSPPFLPIREVTLFVLD